LLIVGSSFPYVEFYPKPGQACAIQIDTDGARIGLRYPVECGLVGDAAKTLAALSSRATAKDNRNFLETAQKGMKAWREDLAEQGKVRDRPMKPQVVAYVLNELLRDDCILTTDSGTNTSW